MSSDHDRPVPAKREPSCDSSTAELSNAPKGADAQAVENSGRSLADALAMLPDTSHVDIEFERSPDPGRDLDSLFDEAADDGDASAIQSTALGGARPAGGVADRLAMPTGDSGPLLERVEVLTEPGLYEVRSLESSSRYYVDTRGSGRPRYLRVAGGRSTRKRLDMAWRPLSRLESLPQQWKGDRYLNLSEIALADLQAWVLRAGSPHVFHTPEPEPGRPSQYWVQSSVAGQIRKLDELPAIVAELLAAIRIVVDDQ